MYVCWGRGGRVIVSVGGGGWCVRVCVLTVQVFPVATPATPAPFLPRPIRAPRLPCTGILLPAAGQSQRRGLGPLHRGRPDTYQGYSPHQSFSNLYLTTMGSCPCPRPSGKGPESPLLDLLPLFLFFQLCLLLPQLRHTGPTFFPLRGRVENIPGV